MMTIRKISSILVITCLGLIISSCGKEKETSSVEEVDLSIETNVIEAFGIVKAEESKDVIIDFPAVVLEVLVHEGQQVVLNEPVLTLDLNQYQSQILDKKIELDIAKLEHQSIVINLQGLTLDDNKSGIDKLKNDLDFSNNLYKQAVEDFKSKENLFKEGAISQEVYNLSKKSMDEAKNNFEDIEYELQMAVKSNERNIETQKNEADILKERITMIENNVANLENKLNKPYILGNQVVSEYENAAIFDIKYSSGNITDTAQKAFSIVNIDNLIVEANVPEEFIKDVKVGESVKIVPVADRAKEYEGSVIYVSNMAFNSNGETVVPVRISINASDSFLLPNYNVDVYINVQ